jgi:hypothetical protein
MISHTSVAMIVARVAELVSGIDPQVIGDRIALLTEAGKLSAFGDVTDWRHSEIALSPDH